MLLIWLNTELIFDRLHNLFASGKGDPNVLNIGHLKPIIFHLGQMENSWF